MAVFNLDCPACGTTLKTSKAVPAGTKLTCPKCAHKFMAPAAKAKKPEFEVVEDEFEVVEDDTVEVVDDDEVEVVDDEPKKMKRSRPDDGGKKFRPRRKKASNAGLITGLIVGAVVLVMIGGSVILAMTLLRGDNSPLGFVPDGTEVVGGVDIDGIYAQTSLGSDIDQLLDASPLAKYKAETNTSYREMLGSVTFGAADMTGTPAASVILKPGKPMDLQKFLTQLTGSATEETIEGRKVFALGPPAGGEKFVLWKPNDSLIVGTADKTLSRVPRSGRAGLNADLSLLAGKAKGAQIWFATTPKGSMRDQIFQAMSGGDQSALGAISTARAFGFWAMISGGTLEMTSMFVCTDAKQAQDLNAAVEAAAKKQAANPLLMIQMAFLPASVQTLQKELMANTTYSVEGGLAKSSAKVPVAVLDAAIRDGVKMAAPFMRQMAIQAQQQPGSGRGR